MVLYRCAMCGSSKIVPETKQEGYNKKKGIWGAALFGVIGALTGTSGNTVTYYHCGDCGAVLNCTMPSFEKESIERCLASPDVFESSLKTYKKQYKNIEWEEKKVVIEKNKENSSLIDIEIEQDEECIIQYMKKKGIPVRSDELYKQTVGGMGLGIRTLCKRGVLKCEKIGEDFYYIMVTDVQEMKKLASEELAIKKARQCINSIDVAIFEKMLSEYKFMTCEEFYDYLKQNNYLTENVIEAEENNVFSKEWFSRTCFTEDKIKSSFRRDLKKGNWGWSDLYILENGGFRRKTEEEIAKEEKERNRKIQEEADTLKPIITTLQTVKKAISISELKYMNEDLRKRTDEDLLLKLECLNGIGIVKINEVDKMEYEYLLLSDIPDISQEEIFLLSDISQEEINKILYKAISSNKIRGFFD